MDRNIIKDKRSIGDRIGDKNVGYYKYSLCLKKYHKVKNTRMLKKY